MNAQKAAIIGVVAIVVVVGAYLVLSPKTVEEQVQEKKDEAVIHADTDYASLLPEKTLAVITVNSLEGVLKKLSPEKYPNIFGDAKMMAPMIGFDPTDPAGYKTIGLDIAKPFGVAALDVVKTQGPQPGGSAVFFLGISDEAKFKGFLNKMMQQSPMPPQNKQIGGLDCMVMQPQPGVSVIATIKGNYWVVYAFSGENAEAQFEADILSADGRLGKNEDFILSVNRLAKDSDFSAFLNMERTIGLVKQFAPPQVTSQIDMYIPEGMMALAGAFRLDAKGMVLSSYLRCNDEIRNAHKGEGNAEDILKFFPADPLMAGTQNSNVEAGWTQLETTVNRLLGMEEMTRELKRELPEGMQMPTNLDEALKMAEDFLAKELNLTVDLREELFLNFQGNSAFALYNFPSEKNIDFDAVAAMKLKDGKKMDALLAKLASLGVLAPSNIAPVVLQKNKSGDFTVYTLDLSELAKRERKLLSINPTFGVSGDYFIITVKKDMFDAIAGGTSKGLLESIQNEKIAEAMKEGYPSAGYVNLKKTIKETIEKFVPARELKSRDAQEAIAFLNHLTEANWQVKVHEKGVSGSFSIITDKDLLAMALEKADAEIKRSKEEMKKWENKNSKWDDKKWDDGKDSKWDDGKDSKWDDGKDSKWDDDKDLKWDDKK